MAQPSMQSSYPGVTTEVRQFLGGRSRKMLIDGKWVEAASGKTFTTVDPATEEPLAEVPAGDKEDVDRAVRAARRPSRTVRGARMTPSERGRAHLEARRPDRGAHRGVRAARDARQRQADRGRARRRHPAGRRPLPLLRRLGDEDRRRRPSRCRRPAMHFLNYTLREPVGVVGQIIPWNFPLLMAAWKLGAGARLRQHRRAQARRADAAVGAAPRRAARRGRLPAGRGQHRHRLRRDRRRRASPRIPTSTRSPSPARPRSAGSSCSAAAGNLKRVSLELGGKSPNIVFADADLDAAAIGAASAIFFNHGQCCCAGSRLFIEQKAYDKVMPKLIDYSREDQARPRHGSHAPRWGRWSRASSSTASPATSTRARRKAPRSPPAAAVRRSCRKGYFVKPTVFTDVRPDMKIVQEEIFGPVVCAIPFKDVEEVARRRQRHRPTASPRRCGRTTSQKAHRMAAHLKAGTVWINCYNVFDAASPFGGYKQSGFGREMGKAALELYTQIKSVWVNLGAHSVEGIVGAGTRRSSSAPERAQEGYDAHHGCRRRPPRAGALRIFIPASPPPGRPAGVHPSAPSYRDVALVVSLKPRNSRTQRRRIHA